MIYLYLNLDFTTLVIVVCPWSSAGWPLEADKSLCVRVRVRVSELPVSGLDKLVSVVVCVCCAYTPTEEEEAWNGKFRCHAAKNRRLCYAMIKKKNNTTKDKKKQLWIKHLRGTKSPECLTLCFCFSVCVCLCVRFLRQLYCRTHTHTPRGE